MADKHLPHGEAHTSDSAGHAPDGHAEQVHANDHGHADHAHGGLGKYIAVFGGLIALTIASFAVGNSPIMSTPAIGWFTMIAISCCKALLVILFFMHLKWEANWKYVLTVPCVIMSIFLMLMLVPDVGMRTRNYSNTRWLYAAQPEAAADHVTEDGAEAAPSEHAGGH